MDRSVYEMGRLRGKLEGKLKGEREGEREGELKMLSRLYERLFQRPLTEGERAALAQRLDKLGGDRLLDVSQELSADALATWLGNPSAD